MADLSFAPRSTTRRRLLFVYLGALVISGAIAMYCAPLAAWGPDQAITYGQATLILDRGVFPAVGLINSYGERNANALVLLSLPFVLASRNPIVISVLLSLSQVLVILWCFQSLLILTSTRCTLVTLCVWLPLLIWTPEFAYTSSELWAQYVARTLNCVLLVLLVSVLTTASRWRDGALGFLLLWLPAIHLALFCLLPVAGIAIVAGRRRRTCALLPVFIGASLAASMCWLPWILANKTALTRLVTEVSDASSVDDNLYYGFTFPLQAVKMLMATSILQLRGNLLTGQTLTLLKIISLLRYVAVIATLIVAVVVWKRGTDRTFVSQLWWAVGGWSVIVAIFGFAGKAPASVRPDFGLMMTQALILLSAVASCRWLSALCLRDPPGKHPYGKLLLLTAGAGTLVICLAGVVAVHRDVLAAGRFSIASIPVSEKLMALHLMVSDAKSAESPVTVSLEIEDYDRIFAFVRYYGRQHSHSLYYPEVLYDRYLLHLTGLRRFEFVSPRRCPQYRIVHPVSQQVAALDGVHYKRIGCGRFLAVWRRIDTDQG